VLVYAGVRYTNYLISTLQIAVQNYINTQRMKYSENDSAQTPSRIPWAHVRSSPFLNTKLLSFRCNFVWGKYIQKVSIRLVVVKHRKNVCFFYRCPKHASCHKTSRQMQAFYAITLPYWCTRSNVTGFENEKFFRKPCSIRRMAVLAHTSGEGLHPT